MGKASNAKKLWGSLAASILLVAAIAAAWGATGVGASAPVASPNLSPNTGVAAQGKSTASKVTPQLREEFRQNGNGNVRYLVVLAEQAKLDNNITDWNAKGQYVLNALKSTAAKTQPAVSVFLMEQQRLRNISSYKGYYIINAFKVEGNLASAEAVAGLADVATVAQYPEIRLDPPTSEPASPSPDAIEWNVNIIRAPQAWALGYTGVGKVVGSLDTGARYTHNAIVGKYRGNLGGGAFDHNYNWWPAVGSSQFPTDQASDSYHGSHTIGTVLGDDGAGNQIGVAPDAKWISTNGIATGVTEPDIIEAGQWMLAPWPLNNPSAPDPSKRPHVSSNSWGNGASNFSCTGQTFFRSIVQSWVAAGIFPSWSAGNAGTTGNRVPAAYPETFETGNITINGVIAGSSSRGPSCFDGGQHPQVMAGGTNVRSVSGAGDNSYQNLTGTSMSQPATAGSVAVLLQANPNLTIPQIWNILTSTAYMSPTWGTPPNSNYGYGLIQLDVAVQMAISMGGTATPTVTGTPPTATATRTAAPPTNTVMPSPTSCSTGGNYAVATATGTIVPGTNDIGNHGDDVVTLVALPFTYTLYDQTFSGANVSSNGNIQFVGTDTEWVNTCLPATDFTYTIYPYWDDQITSPTGKGVFTSTTGTAPNRVFNIEFRTCAFLNPTTCVANSDANYEVRLYEGQAKFDVIYGAMGSAATGSSATIGVQKDATAFTQFSCNVAPSPALTGRLLTFTLPPPVGCPSATATPITTATAIVTGTPPTATATVCVPSSGVWTAVATAPAPARYFADGAGGSDGKFYMVGGLNAANAALANFESFDGATNAWTALAPVPTARGLSAIGSLGGKVFVAGGGIIAGTSFQAIPDTRVYDIATGTWSAGAAMPVAIAAGSYAAVPSTNRFYVFGGFDDTGSDNLTTYIYNPTTNSWSTGADLPSAKTLAAAAEFGGKVYLYGGFGTTNSPQEAVSGKARGVEANTTLLVYDPVANTFTPLAPGPSPRARHAMSARDGQLFVTGGNIDNSFTPTADVFVYNIASNTWSTGPALGTARNQHAQGTLGNGGIIAATGLTPPGTTRSQSAEVLPRGQVCPTPGTTGTAVTTMTSTSISTSTATRTSISTSTSTVAAPTSTSTRTTAPTNTSTSVPTGMPSSTSTVQATAQTTATTAATSTVMQATATKTAAPCLLQFQDVPATNTFYANVRCLACKGIIGGYLCGGPNEPCGTTNNPYFRPNNDITRGQIAKMVSESAGFSEPAGAQIYEDVAPGSTFYAFINRLSGRGLIGGYPCGQIGTEPCLPGNRPYFRPQLNATRGQLAKIVSSAAGFSEPVSGQFYTDVPTSNTFYEWIERLSGRGVMGGYPCGTVPGEPCLPGNKPYFRPFNNVTRGQASKIVANSFFPNCDTPGPIPTVAAPTNTSVAVPTNTSVAAPTNTSVVTPPTNTVPVPSATAVVRQVNIQGFAFVPQNLTITAGTTVRWTNLDSAPHTSTSATGVWDSGTLAQNASYTRTFTTAGSFPYRCDIHPEMLGTIMVNAR